MAGYDKPYDSQTDIVHCFAESVELAEAEANTTLRQSTVMPTLTCTEKDELHDNTTSRQADLGNAEFTFCSG